MRVKRVGSPECQGALKQSRLDGLQGFGDLGFKVSLFDELEQIGECEHERFVIDVAKSGERLKTKAQKLGIALP